MAKLSRVTNTIFASTAPSNTMEQFGSFVQTGIPNYTNDPSIIQGLSAWVDGWTVAINSGNKAPYVQDMNAVLFVLSYQLSYLFQEGIPEWDSGTTYYRNSVVQDNAGNGQWFVSLQDSNIGNTPPVGASNAFWAWVNPPVATVVVGNSLKSGLSVSPNSGAPLTKTTVTASLLSVQGVTLSSINQTADITVMGAGGLDTGNPTNSTWYAIHIITNNLGTSTSIIYSLSPSAPTLPGGFTKFRRVGWTYRNSSGNFRQFLQIGNWINWIDAAAVTQLLPPSAAATGTLTWTVGAPPTCQLAEFDFVPNSGASASLFVRVTGTSMPYRQILFVPGSALLNDNSPIVAMNAGQQFDWQMGGGEFSINTVTVNLAAYYDPI